MARRTLPDWLFTHRVSFGLLAALLALLWLAGGASRADVMGQVAVRAGTWTILLLFVLFAARPRWRPVAPVALFVLAAIALAAVQLIPLPPAVWTDLPGRDLLAQAATVTGQEQPWRPMSISPGATANALSSLVVPLVALLLVTGLTRTEHWRIVAVLLALIFASALMGLLQFSGASFDHPLINDVRGMVSASFANRNHFALFLAIGCLLAPAWALRERQREHRGGRWKAPVAVALVLLFGLIILATGSRMGMLVGALGIGLGLTLVWRPARDELARLPRKVAIAVIVGVIALFLAGVAFSFTLGRAVSIDRALSLETGEDLRSQALPTVLSMIERYFPVGSGFGTFDPVYRISEPDHLLGLAYFNHVHNDWLEVALDGGIAGILLLGAAVVWWAVLSVRAWRTPNASSNILSRLGSAVLLLVMIASLTDYPARTPMIMAILVLAATWLNGVPVRKSGSAGRDERTFALPET